MRDRGLSLSYYGLSILQLFHLFGMTSTTRDSCLINWSAVTPPAHSLITGYILLIDDGKGGAYRVAYDGTNNPSLVEYSIRNLEP